MKNPLHFVTSLISLCPCEHLTHLGWESLVYDPVFYPTTIQDWRGKNQDTKIKTLQSGLPQDGESIS